MNKTFIILKQKKPSRVTKRLDGRIGKTLRRLLTNPNKFIKHFIKKMQPAKMHFLALFSTF